MVPVDHYHAVVDILKEFNVPIIMDADIGHHPPMMPLVSGSMARVTAKENELTVAMKYV